MKKTIGIVGAVGDVGRDTAKDLLKISDYDLILADIKEKEAGELASSLGERATAMHVDVYEPGSLDAVCEKCDLIVSSTGPSAWVVDKVALAALKRGLFYVDIGGSVDLYEALTERDSELKDKWLTYLVSAGISPGFTGTLPMYLMSSEFFDKVDSYEMYLAFGGTKLSFTACHDMLSGYEKRKASGVWKDGAWVPQGPVAVELPSPMGKAMGSPTIEAEIKDFIENTNPGFYGMYICVLSELVALTFGFIVTQRLYESEDQKKASADFFSKIMEYDTQGKDPMMLLYAITKGEKDGQSKTVKAILQTEGERANPTASCAAVYVKMVVEGEITRKGRFWAGQAADPEKYVTHLKELGMKIIIVEE